MHGEGLARNIKLTIIFCNFIIIGGVNRQPYLKTKTPIYPKGINLSSDRGTKSM
jgi:hypothetical protein